MLHTCSGGMTVTSGLIVIQKDSSNLIGISIGGGSPLCPCLYIVQVFDNTPAAIEGTLEAGDELVAVNGQSLKGKTKVEVAKMIQSSSKSVSINYNKLHADIKQGKTLDIILKKVKHRMVESMGSATADALGLSRAILCNDTLVQRLAALEKTENLYKGLVGHAKSTLHGFFDLFQIYKLFGDSFASMGVKEPQPRASEAFTKFAEQHRQMEKIGFSMLKAVKPILHDLGTYLNKAIPDTRLTISKYADAKFEYLSYCLKVKEMDDEEQSYIAIQEPLYRTETGNYEYRLILRCRQNARIKFAKLRSDVLIKLELLENKHVDEVVRQLQKFTNSLADYYTNITNLLSDNMIFPVEVDLSQTALQNKNCMQSVNEYQDEENDDLAADSSKEKVFGFDLCEEAMPNKDSDALLFESQRSTITEAGPSGINTVLEKCTSDASYLSDFKDMEDLNNLLRLNLERSKCDMNQKFEQMMLTDDKTTNDSSDFMKTVCEQNTSLNNETETGIDHLLALENQEETSSFLLLESIGKKDTLSEDNSIKTNSDLLFLGSVDEQLISIDAN